MNFLARFMFALVFVFVGVGMLVALLGVCMILFGEDWGIVAFCATLAVFSAGVIAYPHD